MKLDTMQQNSQGQKGMSNYSFKFSKSDPAARESLLSSQISVGDPVVVSEEGGNAKMALVVGFVKDLSPNMIHIVGDKPINLTTDVEDSPSSFDMSDGVCLRIDKDEFSSGMSMIRDNLLSLFSPTGGRLRKLIVDLEAPKEQIIDEPIIHEQSAVEDLNQDQRDAIHKVVNGIQSYFCDKSM